MKQWPLPGLLNQSEKHNITYWPCKCKLVLNIINKSVNEKQFVSTRIWNS